MKLPRSAPPFALPANDGTLVTMAELRGQWVVLLFYPRDFSPVCTQQLCHYRDRWEALQVPGVCVLGISPDSVERHREFRERHGLPFPLLADPEMAVFRRYQMQLFGRLPARGVVIVDPEGNIRHWWRSLTGMRYPSAAVIREWLEKLRA